MRSHSNGEPPCAIVCFLSACCSPSPVVPRRTTRPRAKAPSRRRRPRRPPRSLPRRRRCGDRPATWPTTPGSSSTADLSGFDADQKKMIGAADRGGRRHQRDLLAAVVGRQERAAGEDRRSAAARVRRAELRPVGPARQRQAVRRRRRRAPARCAVLPGRHEQGRVRAGRPARTRPRCTPCCAAMTPASCRPCPTTWRTRPSWTRPPACCARRRSWPRTQEFANYLDAARRRAAERRLPAQRLRLDGHEVQSDRHRDRPDRDLRRPAVRLQGQLRELRAGEGPGLEQAAGALRQIPARTAARAAGGGQVQGREARLRCRPQCLFRGVLRRRRQRRRQDHRHQPAQRRAGAAEEGHPPAAAGKRDAGEVRHHHAADRARS